MIAVSSRSFSTSVKSKSGIRSFSSGSQHAALVEDRGSCSFGGTSRASSVRDVDEREVEPRDELAALFRQLGADRLRRLEALDVVAAEAAVAGDDALPELELLGLRVHLRQRAPAPRQAASGCAGSRAAPHRSAPASACTGAGVPAGPCQRRQIRRDVGHLRIGQPQVGHVGARVVVLRIADPVVEPLVGRLAADVLRAAGRTCGAGRPPRDRSRR